MGYWPITKRAVKEADIILLIGDVRLPEISFNKTLERIISLNGKEYVRVFNKIDLVSRKWFDNVKSEYKDAFFVSGTKNIGIADLRRHLFIMAKRANISEPRIAVVGYPNLGKSAIINALTKRAKAKVAGRAGTTKGIQWIRAGGLFILDSPGVVPIEDDEAMLGIMGAKNPEKIKDLFKVALKIVKIIFEYDKDIFKKIYGISVEKDYWNILEKIAKKKGLLLKRGVADENRASYMVVKDWQKGKLTI